MLKKLLLLILIGGCWGTFAAAGELSVAESSITTAIENQQPVDRISTYSADFGKLYCFTRIVGATSDTSVTHVWLFRGHEMARVTLPVGSNNWRTNSSKRFLPQWAGDWQVRVLDAEGNELAKIPFVLE
jgi:hypothetical protein